MKLRNLLLPSLYLLSQLTLAQALERRCAVLGYLGYEEGYAERLNAAGVAYDRLDGAALLQTPYRKLLQYQALFIALGIGDEGIRREDYRQKLDLYVRNGGVLVLEQKAQLPFGPYTLAAEVLAEQVRLTRAALPWFGEDTVATPVTYQARLIPLARVPELTVLAESAGVPVMGCGPYGQGWLFYSGMSSGFSVHQAAGDSPYTRVVDGTIRWALSRDTLRGQPEVDRQVAQVLARSPDLPRDRDWIWNMRIVSMKIPRGVDEETLVRQVLPFRTHGVNAIMDHGSMQFVPGLPDAEAPQWKMQVDFAAAEVFTRALHRAGLRVFHHTTTTFVPIEAMKVPGYAFFSRDIRTGAAALYQGGGSDAEAVFADMNDPQWRGIVFPRMREYMRRVRPDAFMSDEVQWLPDQYAGGTERGSRAKFRAEYGFDYPRGGELDNWDSPAWRAFMKFRYDSGRDLYRDLTAALRRENPEVRVTGCLAGISKPWRRVWSMGNESWLSGLNLMFYEAQEQGPPAPLNAYGGTGFLYATLWPTYYREMALVNAAAEMRDTVTFTLGYPQTYQVANSELFYGWAQASLMGQRYWMNDFQFEPEWYAWEAAHEKDLIRPRWIGDVGLFFPEYGRDYQADELIAFKEWAGFGEALAEHAVQFDQLLRWHLEEDHLERFRLIILPEAQFLSPQASKHLARFVRRGGRLVVSGKSAVSDLLDAKVGDGGRFAELLGIEREGWVDGSSSVTLPTDAAAVPAGRYSYPNGYARVRLAPGTVVLAKVDGSEAPAIVSRRFGRGEVITFTGRVGTAAYQAQWWGLDPERFRRLADSSTRQNLAGLVSRLLNGRRRVEFVGLPAQVMAHAHDTLGYGSGAPRRTIHLLESSGGLRDGEAWPTQGLPVRFVPFAERTGGAPVRILLRDLKRLRKATLITPDRPGEASLSATWRAEVNAFEISIEPTLLGRYSVVVVEP